MAGRQYTAKHVNEKTQFDSINSRIDINLKMGTPGENLLSKSKELMKKAALHRLVGLHTFCCIGSLRSIATALNLVLSGSFNLSPHSYCVQYSACGLNRQVVHVLIC